MMKKSAMVKFARARLLLKMMKKGFVPMPGGQMAPPPMDPSMMGAPPPMPPMDPAQMGAYAAPPMGGAVDPEIGRAHV